MKRLASLLLLCVLLQLGGCGARPVHMDWMFTESQRDRGLMTLAVMWNPQHDTPDADPLRAFDLADQKCRTWGYEGAEQVGDLVTQCTRRSSDLFSLCTRKETAVTFRCTGTLRAFAVTP